MVALTQVLLSVPYIRAVLIYPCATEVVESGSDRNILSEVRPADRYIFFTCVWQLSIVTKIFSYQKLKLMAIYKPWVFVGCLSSEAIKSMKRLTPKFTIHFLAMKLYYSSFIFPQIPKHKMCRHIYFSWKSETQSFVVQTYHNMLIFYITTWSLFSS